MKLRNCRRLITVCRAFIALLATGLVVPGVQASTELVVQGVTGRLAENIRLLVTDPPLRSNTRSFSRYINALPQQVVTAMSAYGYYAAQVEINIEDIQSPADDEENDVQDNTAGGGNNSAENESRDAQADSDIADIPDTRINVTVTPNEPVLINELTLEINGPDGAKDDFAAVLQDVSSTLASGKIFVSADYELAKSTFQNIAQDLGYFDFRFDTSVVAVSRQARTASIELIAQSGPRYTFAQVLFDQRVFSKTFMNRWLPYQPGDPFDADLIGELTQNLQSSGYFSSVRVRPQISPRYGKTVPVAVDLIQQDRNKVAVGIGFSTDTKLRTTLTWAKPLLNSNGHSAEWDFSLASAFQSASFTYRIPRLKEPLFNYWGIEYGVKNEDVDDVESFLSTLNLQRVSRTPKDWTESFFIRWERERFTAGGVEDTTDLVLPGVSYSRSRSKGEPFVTWGQSLDFQLMGGTSRVLSSIDFFKTAGRFRYLRAVSKKNTIIATVQAGLIESNDFTRVPVTQRFFAGGDRTVRGFAFRDISPRNPAGEAVGGRFLEVYNLEYNYRFRDLWSFALFSDAGRAFNNFDTEYSVGAGFGLRWQSPVGPFRIDIARPFSDNDGDDVRLHLSLGADL